MLSFVTLKDKQDKIDKVQRWETEINATSPLWLKLMAGKDKLQERSGNNRDLPMDPDVLHATWEDMQKKLAKLKEIIEETSKDDFASVLGKIESVESEMDILRVNIEEQTKSYNWKCKQLGGSSRRQYQAARWKITKMASTLVEGGHDSGFAKFIATRICDQAKYNEQTWAVLVNPALTDFDKKQLAIWFPDGENKLTDEWSHNMNSNKDAVNAKIISLKGALEAHERWPSSIGAMNGIKFEGEALQKDMISGDMEGAGPWMGAIRLSSHRGEFSCISSHGLPTFFYALTDMVVHLTPMKDLLAGGIMLEDFTSFCETPSGLSFLEKHSRIVKVPSTSLLFIPGACVVHVVATEIFNIEKLGYFVHQPFASAEILDEIPQQVKTAIRTRASQHYDTKPNSEMWKARAEWFAKILPPPAGA